MRLAHVPVKRFEIEFKLAEVFRLEFADLELYGNQAVEFPVEKEHIGSKVPPSYLKRHFTADKTEIPAYFAKKPLQITQQALMQVAITETVRKFEKFNNIGIPEKRFSFRMQFSQRC